MKYLLFTLLLTSTAYGQSISVSPTSVMAWGRAPSTILIEAEYKDLSVVGLLPTEKKIDDNGNIYKGYFLGIFYSPVQIGNDLYAKGSVGYFHRKFPTDTGTMLNFRLQIGYKYKSFGIEYSHISNGFKLRDKFNVGVDNISIKYYF